jgi:hypothetical protein
VAAVARSTGTTDTIGPGTFTTAANSTNVGSNVGYKLTASALSEQTTSTLGASGTQALGVIALNPAAAAGTLTVADGAAPSNATLCAAPASSGYVDYFTLLASSVTNVTGVTTTFSPTVPSGLLSLLEVTNDAGTAQGSLANPSGTNPAVTGMSFAAPTGTAAQYRLRITPSASATTSGTFTATVTGVTTSGGFGVTGTDGSSATVIVDGAGSPVVTGATATGSTGTVTASWTNPTAGTVPATDFGGYVVVLGNTVATTGAPAKGTAAYAAGTAVGADTVVCSGNLTTCAKTGLASAQPYYLTIFTRDGCANWSAGVSVNATTTAAPTTTIADGVNPTVPATWVAPGTGAVAIDSFTVLKSGGTQAESISAVTVTFATGTAQGIGLVEILDDALTTTYGSVVNPADVQAITLSTAITPTTTSAQYKLRVTPKTHAAMPAPPGASYAVQARVTDVTVTYSKSVNDATSSTLNVDNASSPNVSAGGTSVTGSSVTANWSNPAAGTVPATDFGSYVVVLGNTVAVTGAPVEGVATYAAGATVGADSVVCSGNITSCAKTGLAAGQAYFFRVFTRDALANWSTGVAISGTTADARTTPVALSASAASCTLVNLAASYTGDLPVSNNAVTFARAAVASGPFADLASCTAVGGGANPRACGDGGVSAGQTWYYRATFADADGVVGTPYVDSGALVVPSCAATLSVAAGSMPAGASVGAGSSGTPVARFNVTPSAALSLTSLALANTGTAVADLDVASLSLYDDTTSTFIASSVWNAATSRYVFGGLAYALSTARTLRVDLNVSSGATVGRTFVPQLPAGAVSVAAPNQVGAYTTITGSTFTLAAGATEGNPNAAAPMVSIINPVSGGVVSGDFKVQVRVFNPTAGIAGVTSVKISVDNGATWPYTATRNANYDATNATVFEYVVPAPAPGPRTLRAQAVNAVPLTTLSGAVLVTAAPARAGDGKLLVRDNSSQLCSDCHGGIKTHSTESTSTKYGAWATACRDCHQPHGTRNVELVAETITPPSVSGAQSSKHVGFVTRTGDSNAAGWDSANGRPTATASYANSDNTGPCQVCHTRTVDPNAAAPQPARWRNTGNADPPHYAATGVNGTSSCGGCHSHASGFAGGGEPAVAGSKCSGCHSTIFSMVKTGGQANAHRIDLDQAGDTSLDWSAQATLAGVPSTQRSCLNMCHGDHPHTLTSPATATHQGNVYADPSTNASRGAAAATRVASGATPVNRAVTDFDPAVNDGLCVKCHQKPIAAGGLTVTAAAFGASAHDYTSNAFGTWTYPLHDGATFARNCTKCHASRAEGTTPSYGTTGTRAIQTVHGSASASLLAGELNPATTNGTVDTAKRATFICYNCHGNATVGANLSGKDIQSQVNHANNAAPQSGHPSDKDAVHVSATEYANAAFGAGLGAGIARHAACEDCHDSHKAKAGTHAVTTNVAGPPLEGSWGAQLSSNPTFWTAPAAGNLTKKSITAGTDLEATLCFKCHSAWYGTLPTSPSGAFTETDQAKEFNPANAGNWFTAGTTTTWSSGETAGGFHPVLATAGNNLGQVNLANLVTTNFAWRTTGARNLMTCTDCHESNTTTDPNGPHGSAAGFILRGPNTTWNNTVAVNGSNPVAGVFCWNCHSSTYASSRFPGHSNGNHNVACQNCHAAIPHGGPRIGMLNPAAGTNTTNLPAIAGWDGAAPYWNGATSNRLYLVSYPSGSTNNWAQSNCGCNGTGH